MNERQGRCVRNGRRHGAAARIAMVLVAGLTVPTCGGPRITRPKPPSHIVIFLADDLGYADVSYHGGDIPTPHIDALARGGVHFTHFYAEALCTPSRAALLTGRFPFRMGLQEGVISPWDRHALPSEERTLAEALRDHGYRCAIVGKWHLGRYARTDLPDRHGFDHHYGCYTDGCDYYTHRAWDALDWFRNTEPVEESGYATDLLAAEAVALIEEHDPTTPLFLYLPFTAPHTPLQAPPRTRDACQGHEDPDRRTYCEMVGAMDDGIGRVVQALRARGMLDDTVVFFASDNGGWHGGGARNTPLRGGKGEHYEGGRRVPALLHWPAGLAAKGRVDHPVHLVDVYPTLLALVGAEHDGPRLDGRDAWGLISGQTTAPLHDAIPLTIGNRWLDAVRQGDWKLLRPTEGEPELYDLANDPTESKNVASRYPDRVGALSALADRYRKEAVVANGTRWKPADFESPKTWAPSVETR